MWDEMAGRFKFSIGDVVEHRSYMEHHAAARLVVTDRLVVETASGLTRWYQVRGCDRSGILSMIAAEVELRAFTADS